jgi:hypothetical protein
MKQVLQRLIWFSLIGFVPAWASADVITDWNNVLLDAVRTTPLNPPKATRVMAMMNTAMYDAVNSIAQTHEPYHINLAAAPGTSREAAAAQAAYQVLSSNFPALQSNFDTALNNSLAVVAEGAAKTDGINLGTSVGDAILALRANDGSDEVVPYVPGEGPGQWQPTPPANAPALLPNWPNVTPWAMTSGSQFRSLTGPPELDSPEYTANFNEVKEIGRADSVVRTADQSNIAQFWADNAGTSTPPGHWNRIAQQIAEMKGNTLEENARLFALLGITVADSAISCWDNKYAFNDWRPVTAIHNADTDGNPDTEADTEWTSFIPTPPFPSYTSGHSTFSGASAALLAAFFGTDEIAFTDSAEGYVVPDRSFTSLSQAAEEAMNSRLYGGIHWRYDNEDGLAAGTALGTYVFATQLRPIPEPTAASLLLGAALLGLPLVRRGRARRS